MNASARVGQRGSDPKRVKALQLEQRFWKLLFNGYLRNSKPQRLGNQNVRRTEPISNHCSVDLDDDDDDSNALNDVSDPPDHLPASQCHRSVSRRAYDTVSMWVKPACRLSQ